MREQLLLGHRYRNKLVEVELGRRNGYSEALALRPQVGALRAKILALEEELQAQRESVQESRTGTKRRKQEPEGAESAAVLRKELSGLYKRLRVEESAARKLPEVKAAIRESDDRSKQAATGAYAEYGETGLYWGTRCSWNRVAKDQFRKGPPPRYRRWDGSGTIAVQLQSQGERNGYGAEALFGEGAEAAAARRLVQIDRVPGNRRAGRSGKLRRMPSRKDIGVIRLRVGSDGRDPVWAEWPVILHRPLPVGARVKWVRVKASRVGTRVRWSLHLEFELPGTWIKEPGGSGVVALDLNWRRVALVDDLQQVTLRAGSYAGSDGEAAKILLNPEIRSGLRKAADLHSIRQKHFDAAKEAAHALVRAATLDEEHREKVETLPRWRSPNRLAALAIWWRDNRCAGDDALLAVLEEWRKRDKHLLEWEANARRKAVARREHDYRNVAANLARRYSTLLVEDIDLRTVTERPAPEDPSYEERSDLASSQRVEVAPSELRRAVVQAFKDRGGAVVEVPSAGSAAEILARWREVHEPAPRTGISHAPTAEVRASAK